MKKCVHAFTLFRSSTVAAASTLDDVCSRYWPDGACPRATSVATGPRRYLEGFGEGDLYLMCTDDPDTANRVVSAEQGWVLVGRQEAFEAEDIQYSSSHQIVFNTILWSAHGSSKFSLIRHVAHK